MAARPPRSRHPHLAVVLLLSLRLAALARAEAPGPRPDEALVKFADGPRSYAAQLGHAAVGATVLREFPTFGWQHVRLPPGLGFAAARQRYLRLTTAVAVEPNRVDQPARVPDDPRFPDQWYWRTVHATDAWDLTTGSPEVIVAVIDTGLDYRHEDLQANLWRNPLEIPDNGLDDDANGYVDDVFGIDAGARTGDPQDLHGHGTWCAGLIGAVGDNGRGLAGLNWQVRLLALKHASLPNGFSYHADTLACFDYALSLRARGEPVRVINYSYTGEQYDAAFLDALEAASAHGILVVAAAGNGARDLDLAPSYPAGFHLGGLVAVAATDAEDALLSFSNYGRASVDLAAPGRGLLTTGLGPAAYFQNFTGTSAACPLVAGAAALLAAHRPHLTPAELKAALLASVDRVPALAPRVVSGGRLNVARALEFAAWADAPPFVLGAVPAGARTATNAVLRLTFNRAMEPASVEEAWRLEPALPGAFAWDDAHRTVTFRPAAALPSATRFVAGLEARARDASGATLDGNANRVSEGSPADDFRWEFSVPPVHDDFARALELSGARGRLVTCNDGATLELGEPRHAGQHSAASVWFRWVAPADGLVTVEATSSVVDTVLAVYPGSPWSGWRELAGNDDAPDAQHSRVTWPAVRDTTYRVALASKELLDPAPVALPTGEIVLSWSVQPQLAIALVETGALELRWAAGLDEFALETATVLDAAPDWRPWPGPVEMRGRERVVRIVADPAARYFRLRAAAFARTAAF